MSKEYYKISAVILTALLRIAMPAEAEEMEEYRYEIMESEAFVSEGMISITDTNAVREDTYFPGDSFGIEEETENREVLFEENDNDWEWDEIIEIDEDQGYAEQSTESDTEELYITLPDLNEAGLLDGIEITEDEIEQLSISSEEREIGIEEVIFLNESVQDQYEDGAQFIEETELGEAENNLSQYANDVDGTSDGNVWAESGGACGENLFWSIHGDEDAFILEISGTGDMYDYEAIAGGSTRPSYFNRYTSDNGQVPWFDYLGEITDIVINEGVTSIGTGAFAFAGKDSNGKTFAELYQNDNKMTAWFYFDSITLPSTLKEIHHSAFFRSGCDSIVLPDGLTTLEGGKIGTVDAVGYGRSFYFSTFHHIHLGAGIQTIPTNTFENSLIETIDFPQELRRIENCAFRGSSLKNAILPDGLWEIEYDAFSDSDNLEAVYIPSLVYSIKENAFAYCNNLRQVEFGEGLTSIGKHSDENGDFGIFSDCTLLTNVVIPEGVTEIGDQLFKGCTSLVTCNLPATLKEAYYTFQGCTNLKSCDIGDGVEKVVGTFYGCTSLETCMLPRSVRNTANAFTGCKNLREINIQNGVTNIDSAAFSGCSSLKQISIPASVNTIESRFLDTMTVSTRPAFEGCTALESIEVAAGNPYYKSANGCLYNDTLTALIYIPEGVSEAVVPGNVTSVLINQNNNGTLYFQGNAPEEIVANYLRGELLLKGFFPSGDTSWSQSMLDLYEHSVSSGLSETKDRILSWIWDKWQPDIAKTDILIEMDVNTKDSSGNNLRFPMVKVTDNGRMLTETIDYDLSVSVIGAANSGKGTVTLTGKGKYYGKIAKAYDFSTASGSNNGSNSSSVDHSSGGTSSNAVHTHSWGAWTITKIATVLEKGQQTRVCSSCKAKELRELPLLKPTGKVSMTSVVLKAGAKSSALKITGLANGDSLRGWISLNPKIALVSQSGVIEGKAPGKTIVLAVFASGMRATVKVQIQENKTSEVKTGKKKIQATAIKGLKKKITIKKGKKVTLKPKLKPTGCTDKIRYKSSNKKIAKVSSKGVITGKKAGTAKITVTAGKVKVVINVTVKK